MKKLAFALSALVLSFGLASTASAQSKGYVGAIAGLSVPDYDNTSARPGYGVLAGARLDGEWGVGAFFLTSSKKESGDLADFDFNYNLYGIEGSYHFEGLSENAYVAARIGMAKVEGKSSFNKANISPMVWGINFGYDHPLAEAFSLGAEAGFMSVGGDKDGTQEIKAFTMLNFLVAAKFWF